VCFTERGSQREHDAAKYNERLIFASRVDRSSHEPGRPNPKSHEIGLSIAPRIKGVDAGMSASEGIPASVCSR